MKSLIVFVLAATSVVACGRLRYAYAPVTTTAAEIEGEPAVVAPMPPDVATGRLRVASLGVAPVSPPAGSGMASFHGLYVRFALENDGAEAWSFDEAEQRIEVLERGERTTIWARTPAGARPPVVQAPAHATTSVDVLFPLGARDAGDLASFDVIWSVHAGARLASGRASFARHIEKREPAPAAFDPGAPPPARLPQAVPSCPP